MTSAVSGPPCPPRTIASMASGAPSTRASTVRSWRLRTQPAMPSDSASRRIDSRNQTPCTRPRTTRRLAMRSLIAAYLAPRALLLAHLLLALDAALPGAECGSGGHALGLHVVQPLEPFDEPRERGLAIAVLRRRILRDDHHAGRP